MCVVQWNPPTGATQWSPSHREMLSLSRAQSGFSSCWGPSLWHCCVGFLWLDEQLWSRIWGSTLGLMFLCWLKWEIPNRQSGKLQLHRLYHPSSAIAKDQSELPVPELRFDTLQALINHLKEKGGWMVTLWPATRSRLIPPAVMCRWRKVPWCMSLGERGWKSCLNACNCHRITKQAKWMLGFSIANVTLDSLCLQIQSAYIYFYLSIHCVDSNFVRDKILQSEPEFPVNGCISIAAAPIPPLSSLPLTTLVYMKQNYFNESGRVKVISVPDTAILLCKIAC